MKSILFIAAFSLVAVQLAFAGDPLASPEASAKLSDSDLAIVSDLHHANQSEVDMGNYALTHGTKAIKDYANTLVKDHSANDAKLIALAKHHGVATIPAPPPDKAAKASMMKLETMTGASFDRAYLAMMVDDHYKNINKVTAALGTVTNADLTAHLAETKPALQRHLDDAKALQSTSTAAQR